MEVTLIVIALIAYLGFRQWLRQHRRSMIHRERLAAIEKGIELPPLEQGSSPDRVGGLTCSL